MVVIVLNVYTSLAMSDRMLCEVLSKVGVHLVYIVIIIIIVIKLSE